MITFETYKSIYEKSHQSLVQSLEQVKKNSPEEILILARLNRLEDTEGVHNEARHSFPTDNPIIQEIDLIFMVKNHEANEKIEAQALNILRQNPEMVYANKIMGYLMEKKKDRGKARRYYEAVIRFAPYDIFTHIALAIIYNLQKKPSLVRQHVRAIRNKEHLTFLGKNEAEIKAYAIFSILAEIISSSYLSLFVWLFSIAMLFFPLPFSLTGLGALLLIFVVMNTYYLLVRHERLIFVFSIGHSVLIILMMMIRILIAGKLQAMTGW